MGLGFEVRQPTGAKNKVEQRTGRIRSLAESHSLTKSLHLRVLELLLGACLQEEQTLERFTV